MDARTRDSIAIARDFAITVAMVVLLMKMIHKRRFGAVANLAIASFEIGLVLGIVVVAIIELLILLVKGAVIVSRRMRSRWKAAAHP